jgi:hypothetical protein
LERGDQITSNNKPHDGLDRLVDEGIRSAAIAQPIPSDLFITAKGRAALHEAEGND